MYLSNQSLLVIIVVGVVAGWSKSNKSKKTRAIQFKSKWRC
jgi:hypothetical protein